MIPWVAFLQAVDLETGFSVRAADCQRPQETSMVLCQTHHIWCYSKPYSSERQVFPSYVRQEKRWMAELVREETWTEVCTGTPRAERSLRGTRSLKPAAPGPSSPPGCPPPQRMLVGGVITSPLTYALVLISTPNFPLILHEWFSSFPSPLFCTCSLGHFHVILCATLCHDFTLFHPSRLPVP